MISRVFILFFLFFSTSEEEDMLTVQAWTLAAGIGCGILAHMATRMFSRSFRREAMSSAQNIIRNSDRPIG